MEASERAQRRPGVSRTAGILSVPLAWQMRLASPDDQPHLGPEADVGLLVLIHVGRRLDIDAARPNAVVVQENPLPRNLDPVAHQDRVVLVEAIAERIIGLLPGVALIGLACPERDAGALLGSQRYLRLALVVDGGVQIADIDLARQKSRAGGQYLRCAR